MSGQILAELRDGILHVSIERPEKRNALDEAMFSALADKLTDANEAANVAVVLIRERQTVSVQVTTGNSSDIFGRNRTTAWSRAACERSFSSTNRSSQPFAVRPTVLVRPYC